MSQTLFEKIWDSHVIVAKQNQPSLIYIDRHLVHEVTSPQAFEGLRINGRKVRRPDLTIATMDHNVPTTNRSLPIIDQTSATQIHTLEKNCQDFGIRLFGMNNPNQGIVHVIGPQLGITLPGTTIVCGDSHTSTQGAFGALAFGIGTSEVEHVLASQTLWLEKLKPFEIKVNGKRKNPLAVSAKDIILSIIRQIGISGGIRPGRLRRCAVRSVCRGTRPTSLSYAWLWRRARPRLLAAERRKRSADTLCRSRGGRADPRPRLSAYARRR